MTQDVIAHFKNTYLTFNGIRQCDMYTTKCVCDLIEHEIIGCNFTAKNSTI